MIYAEVQSAIQKGVSACLRYRRKLLLLFATVCVLLVAGCATTQETADRVNRQFVGQNVDAFFLKYGMPYQKHVLNNGDLIYDWSSGVNSFGLPATITFQGNTAQPVNGGSVSVFCDPEIVTAPVGTIKAIKVTQDSWGVRTISRCSEVLK